MIDTDGVIFGDESLATLTDPEREAYARRLVEEGTTAIRARLLGRVGAPVRQRPENGAGAVSGPVTSPVEASSEPAESADPDLFQAGDLYDFSAYPAEPVRMPNGKRLWVHPLSQDQKRRVNQQVLAHFRRTGQTRPVEDPVRERLRQEQLNVDALFLGQVWAAIYCARQGPEPEAKPVFAEQDAPALLNNPGWSDAVETIASTAERLANAPAEARILREMLLDFFDAARRSLAILSSRLTTAPVTALETAGILEDYAISVSSMTQHWRRSGEIRTAEMQALQMVFSLPEAEPAGTE